MYFAIYALIADGKAFYVGSTNNPHRRARDHKRRFRRKHSFKILEEGTEGRFLVEQKWMEKLRKQGCRLVNHQTFREGIACHSEATKKLIRNSGARKTQFRRGAKIVNRAKWIKSKKAHWARLSAETKSRILRNVNLKAWANRTPEERSRIGQKIAATRVRNHTPEELSAIAKRNAAQLIKRRPNIGQEARARMKNWWKSLSPRERASYLRRRTAKIIAAKQAKRLNANP